MTNDATTTRSEIERIDWANIAHLTRSSGSQFVESILPEAFTKDSDIPYHNIKGGHILTHTCTDRRRKVRQVFTVSLVEEPLEDGS